MKLELEVLASTSIKRKKPWPKLAFMGKESVFLLDSKRLSVLYVQSGKTKRKIPKLQPLLQNVLHLTHSRNGAFIGGLLKSGDLFLWHKEKDMLRMICGTEDLALLTENMHEHEDNPKPYVCISDEGTRVLLVLHWNLIYVWEIDPTDTLYGARQTHVRGAWSQVMPDDTVVLPDMQCRETSVQGTFYVNKAALGLVCACCFVFNMGNELCVAAVSLRWFEAQDIYSLSHPTYTAEWNVIKYPLANLAADLQPIRLPGAYVSSYSNDGQLLAVAVNQASSHANKMLFVSSMRDTLIVSDMRGCGAKKPVTRNARTYWVMDMVWDRYDLFVMCMTKQGTMCILSRLGEPLLLQTYGNSIDMGPKPFLPLHPLIMVSGMDEDVHVGGSTAQQAADDKDPMKQKFSICSHPSRPILLCSDGYMVTVLQMTRETSCLSLMKSLVAESSHYLRHIRKQHKLQVSLFESLLRQGKIGAKRKVQMNATSGIPRLGLAAGHRIETLSMAEQPVYRFEEEPADMLNTTVDSDADDFLGGADPTQNLPIGKIMFGDVENLNTTLDYSVRAQEDSLSLAKNVHKALRNLCMAWGLAVSHTGTWTFDHDDACSSTVENLIRLLNMMLSCSPEVLAEVASIDGSIAIETEPIIPENKNLFRVLQIFKSLFRYLPLDMLSKHLMVSSLNFAHSLVQMLLSNEDLRRSEPLHRTVHGCFVILRFCEQILLSAYGSIPKQFQVNSLFGHDVTDIYEPTLMPKYNQSNEWQNRQLHKDADKLTDAQRSEEMTCLSASVESDFTLLKRLSPTWHLLLFLATRHYKQLLPAPGGKKRKPNKATRIELRKTRKVIYLIQCKLQSLQQDLKLQKRILVHNGDKWFIEGSLNPAVLSWIGQLKDMADDEVHRMKGERALHAILYTLLQQEQLRSAVEFVEFLIRQSDVRKAASLCTQEEEKKASILGLLQELPGNELIDPPKLIRSGVVRHVVRSFARIMAAYFSNRVLFTFPSHAPRPIPALHTSAAIGERVVPLCRESLTASISQQHLSDVWTPYRTLEYLILSGCLAEAVWFINALGDWKMAFLMAVALQEHQSIIPDLYAKNKTLKLPVELQADAILRSKLEQVFQPQKEDGVLINEETNLNDVTRTLSDLLLAATISDIDVTPWLVQVLVDRLKKLAKQFRAIVPDGLYLPAPPLYCPQPILTEPSKCNDVMEEIRLRKEVSSTMQLVLLILNSSHTTLPAARWYARKVWDAFLRGLELQRRNVEDIRIDMRILEESYLWETSSFEGAEENESIHSVLGCFRDLCSLTWMFYVRDTLSLMLRKKTALADTKMNKMGVSDTEWLELCAEALDWSLHILPFCRFFECAETELLSTVFSLLLEQPPGKRIAKILAQYFYDIENLPPEIQDKMEWVLKDWQGVFPEGEESVERKRSSKLPGDKLRGSTLSMFFHKQARKINKTHQQKYRTFGNYEEYVFANIDKTEQSTRFVSNGIMYVGARPFEVQDEYLQFLDMFYAVSFNKLVDAEEESPTAVQKPMLRLYAKQVRSDELNSLAHQVASSYQRKQNLLEGVLRSPRNQSPVYRSPLIRSTSHREPSAVSDSSRHSVGLFRSRSMSDISPSRITLKPPTGNAIRDIRSISQSNLLDPTSNELIATRLSKTRPVSADSIDTTSFTTDKNPQSSTTTDSASPKITESPAETIIDPLTLPLLSPRVLENIMFGARYSHLEQLLRWLHRWAARNHIFASGTKRDVSEDLLSTPVMRIQIPTRLIVYGLWAVEDRHSAKVPNIRSKLNLEDCAVTDVNHIHEAGNPNEPIASPQNLDQPITAMSYSAPDETRVNDSTRKKAGKKRNKLSSHPEALSVSDLEHEIHNKEPACYEDRANKGKSERHISFKEEPQQISMPAETTSEESESTILVSSLASEEMRQTMRETMSRLQGRMPQGELDDFSPRHEKSGGKRRGKNSSAAIMLNSTLRFPKDEPADGREGDVAQDIKLIIRNELRRIMEAQQRGIMVMMGALDDSDQGPSLPISNPETLPKRPSSKPAHVTQPISNMKVDAIAMDPAQTTQMTSFHHAPAEKLLEADSASNQKAETLLRQSQQPIVEPNVHVDDLTKSSTENDVTPLPSDEILSDILEADKPLRLSELTRSNQGLGEVPRQNSLADQELLQKLSELQIKEGQDQVDGLRPNEKHAKSHFRKSSQLEKENAYRPQANLLGNQASVNEPFGRLMGILRQFNQKMTVPDSEPQQMRPQLLKLPSEQDNMVHGLHFPPVPQQAWDENTVNEQPTRDPGPLPRMPLLQIDNRNVCQRQPPVKEQNPLPNVFQAGYFKEQISNTAAPPAGAIPLLRLNYEQQQNMANQPRLIPPGDIISYEQRNFKNKQHIMDFVQDKMNAEAKQVQAARAQQGQPLWPKLLKIDVEPFAMADERDSKQREKRRKKKSKTVKKKEMGTNKSSDMSEREKDEQDVSSGRSRTADRLRPKQADDKTVGDKETSEEDSLKLHPGYALTPGMFDEYLQHQDQLGSVLDTNAKIQYQAAMRLKAARKSGVTRKDVAIETEEAGLVDRGTSITTEAGTDPVQEAIHKYYRAKTGRDLPGGVLAPDIFLGLKFEDARSDENGRAFINVVDINGDMLDDLQPRGVTDPETRKPRQVQDKQGSVRVRGSGSPIRQKGELSDDQAQPSGHDHVTAKLLGDQRETDLKMPSVDELAHGERFRTREQIRRRLDTMNEQFHAIATMTQNMEHDLKNTSALAHTIEQIGQAIHPSDEEDSTTPQGLRQRGQYDDHPLLEDATPLTLSDVRRHRRQDKRSEGRTTHRTEQEDEEVSGEKNDTGRSAEDEALHLSGLSGLSDILGEVFGQTQRSRKEQKEADRLVDKALQDTQEGVRLSSDQLKDVFDKKSPRPKKKRTEEEKGRLYDWMKKQKMEQQKEYTKKRAELIEKELHPYQKDKSSHLKTQTDIQAAEDNRHALKKERDEQFADRRREQASQLMSNLLGDRLNLPQEPPPSDTKDKTPRNVSKRPVVKADRGVSPSKAVPYRRRHGMGSQVRRTDEVDMERFDVCPDDYMHLRDSHDIDDRRIDTRTKVIAPPPKGDDIDMRKDGVRFSEEFETYEPPDVTQPSTGEREPEKAVKPKSYTELVKVQRPEITRQDRHDRPKPKPYVERLSQLSNAGSARSTPKTDRSQQRLYGSARLPGTYRQRERKAPRVVKTYTERLQEMKNCQTYSQPIVPRSRPVSTGADRSTPPRYPDQLAKRGIAPRKLRKPVTYAQQLQRLQPPKEMHRGGPAVVTPRQIVGKKRRGPAHPPMTYAQQLQKLQRPPGTYYADEFRRQAERRMPSSRVRSRPYGDPYSEDDMSVISPWSVGDDIKKLIYDGEGAPSAATDLDISEITDFDYSNMVDIGLIEEAAEEMSIGSGSIASFIDWDEVDRLIEDA